jgi:hypothetical protein
MYTHETTIVEDSYTLYVEIDCNYDPPEFSREGCPTLPGHIELIDVRLRKIVGHGKLSYTRERNTIHPDWLEMVDAALYDIVDDEVASWARIADEIVEAVM